MQAISPGSFLTFKWLFFQLSIQWELQDPRKKGSYIFGPILGQKYILGYLGLQKKWDPLGILEPLGFTAVAPGGPGDPRGPSFESSDPRARGSPPPWLGCRVSHSSTPPGGRSLRPAGSATWTSRT